MIGWPLASDHISFRYVIRTAIEWVTYAWFAFYSGALVVGAFLRNVAGRDAILYSAAAKAWLTGGNPWLTTIAWNGGANTFAAPPPTLLFFAPFAFLPPPIVGSTWVIADAIAIVFVVRHLRRPWLWCLFPPLIDAAILGNPEPVMLAMLLVGARSAEGIAVLLKPYATVPLILHRRWAGLAVAIAVGVITIPFLPWRVFFASLNQVQSTLALESGGGLDAWTMPILVPIAALGLVALGSNRAGWLAVPVLWPYAQLHYLTMAIPALTTLSALAFAVPIPGASSVAVAIMGLVAAAERWSSRPPRHRASGAGTPLDTNAGSGGATSAA